MPNQVTRDQVVRWLQRNDFEELPGGKTSHRQFAHRRTGVKIVIPGHGPTDLTKKHFGMILRMLATAGFDRAKARADILAT